MLQVLATQADPIFIGNLIEKHIGETYPKGVVLVCAVREDGMFDRDLLATAFGEKGTEDLCSDITGFGVLLFEEGTTPEDVANAMEEAAERKSNGSYQKGTIKDGYTIYQDGKPV